MGDVPFRQVHIHGLVRDAEKQKMSKTKGNTIDPLVINEKFGTDAVRFALLISAAPGGDIALSEDRIASCRNFANKIWNASRLLFSKPNARHQESLTLADRWIGHRLNWCAEMVNQAFETHRYHEAAQELWHFFWDDFCDWYLEFKKPDTAWHYAYEIYEAALRLLHPLMPFLTEELWQRLKKPGKSIALQPYPRGGANDFRTGRRDHSAEVEMTKLQNLIVEIRRLRTENKVEKSKVVVAMLGEEGGDLAFLEANRATIERMGNVRLTFTSGSSPLRLNVPNIQVDRTRLLKENAELEKVIANSNRQLDNTEVIGKMPAHVVETLRTKNAAYKAQLQKNLDALGAE
jgi:valyl-tRNA synthetase